MFFLLKFFVEKFSYNKKVPIECRVQELFIDGKEIEFSTKTKTLKQDRYFFCGFL